MGVERSKDNEHILRFQHFDGAGMGEDDDFDLSEVEPDKPKAAGPEADVVDLDDYRNAKAE